MTEAEIWNPKHIIFKAKCKMKSWPLFRNYYEFHNDDSRTLNKVWGPSKHRTLCDCRSWTPVKLALIVLFPKYLSVQEREPIFRKSWPLASGIINKGQVYTTWCFINAIIMCLQLLIRTEVISKIKNSRSREKKSPPRHGLLKYGMPTDFIPQSELIELFWFFPIPRV